MERETLIVSYQLVEAVTYTTPSHTLPNSSLQDAMEASYIVSHHRLLPSLRVIQRGRELRLKQTTNHFPKDRYLGFLYLLKIYFYFICVFACMYVYAQCMCLVPVGAVRGHLIPCNYKSLWVTLWLLETTLGALQVCLSYLGFERISLLLEIVGSPG